ncbi:MAG: DUF72 domain-containing protein [Anaerolineae bacterium]|nr:DUF72 domain-containing protein [Anaerolineae bacterium]
MASIRIGTCSWKFPSWQGLVYSADTGSNDLAEYAKKYDTVEVDQWFWSLFGQDNIGLPKPPDVAAYRSSVADDFRFTIKAPNSITLTHLYKKAKNDPLVTNPSFLSAELLAQFLARIAPLQDVCGPIMFQFEYLNKVKMVSQAQFQKQFEAFAGQIDRSWSYALEVRNPNYVNQGYFEFLNKNNVIPVLVQGYWMPPVTSIYRNWKSLILEHGTVVVRLLGPDRQGIEKQTGKRWDRRVAPKDEELKVIVDMVKEMAAQGIEVYLNVNNHYEGSAPLTIAQIQRLM